jgi:hypothetical protein
LKRKSEKLDKNVEVRRQENARAAELDIAAGVAASAPFQYDEIDIIRLRRTIMPQLFKGKPCSRAYDI